MCSQSDFSKDGGGRNDNLSRKAANVDRTLRSSEGANAERAPRSCEGGTSYTTRRAY